VVTDVSKISKKVAIGEMYSCLQGEGRYVGIPHLLIRVTGCKLRCQFAESFCDTPYASWAPEKGIYNLNDVVNFYKDFPHITYTMITGGGPTAHPKLLKDLCNIAVNNFNHFVTIETEGSEFVQTDAQFISLSPKLSNSTPRVGTLMPFTGKEVTAKEKNQHEKWRTNYDAMKDLLSSHEDYQVKPVISNKTDLEEFKALQKILSVPNNKVYLMPEGLNRNQLMKRRLWLTDICVQEGYNYTDRLHIITYGDKRGV